MWQTLIHSQNPDSPCRKTLIQLHSPIAAGYKGNLRGTGEISFLSFFDPNQYFSALFDFVVASFQFLFVFLFFQTFLLQNDIFVNLLRFFGVF